MKIAIFLKKLSLLTCVLLAAVSLASCNGNSTGNNNGNNNNNNNNIDNTGGVNTEPKSFFAHIIMNDNIGNNVSGDLFSGIFYTYEQALRIADDSFEKADSEIVIGRTNRDISSKAYAELAKLDKTENESGYLVYYDGASIALAYDTDKYGLNAAGKEGIKCFIEEIIPMLGDDLSVGVIRSEKVDPIEYQQAIDRAEKEVQWLNFEAVAGKETTEALKEFYARYETNFIEWCANLYDPKTGGFYYSNSARDNPGYLPDIESTFQMLSMFESSGMIDHRGGRIEYMPKKFLTKMALWIKGLQDPNGYFYHPQWTKEFIDTKLARRGRDLSYGTSVLFYAGLSPTYDTPDGAKGDYTLPDGTKVDENGDPVSKTALTHRLVKSPAVAVSKVVAVASNAEVPAHLESAESFRAYLYQFDLKNNSYWVANQLSNQVGQISKRDKELDGALVEVLEAWMIEFQNPANGMWEWRDENDPTYSDYDGVNGILKLLTLFNGLGIEYPNPIPAARSIMKSIYTDDPVWSVCYCYNAWFALHDLFDNLVKHSKDLAGTNALIAEMRAQLRNDAPMLIRKSLEKVMVFVKEDGSSSFAPNESSGTSQGAPVAIFHTNEGDVNGSLINTFGVLNHMFRSLGWSRPAVYGKAEYLLFMDIVASKDAEYAIKDPTPTVYGYDSETIGSVPDFISLERCTSSGEKKITTIDGRTAFMLESKAGGNDLLYINAPESDVDAKCFIFESDMCIDTSDEGYFMRLYLDSAYAMGLIVENGKIRFIDTSKTGAGRVETDLGFTAPVGEWFNLRVEYYFGLRVTKTKIFLNGEQVAESDNFYDPDDKGIPSDIYDKARFEVFTNNTATVYFDNTILAKGSEKYQP